MVSLVTFRLRVTACNVGNGNATHITSVSMIMSHKAASMRIGGSEIRELGFFFFANGHVVGDRRGTMVLLWGWLRWRCFAAVRCSS